MEPESVDEGFATIITRTLGEYDRFLRESSKQGKEYIDMCEAVKKAFAEVKDEGKEEIVIHFLSKNNRVSEAAELLGLSKERIHEIAKKNKIELEE